MTDDEAFEAWWLHDFGYPGIDRYDGPPSRDVARAAWGARGKLADEERERLRELLRDCNEIIVGYSSSFDTTPHHVARVLTAIAALGER